MSSDIHVHDEHDHEHGAHVANVREHDAHGHDDHEHGHDDHDDHGHHAPEPYFGEAVPENRMGIILPILVIIATLSIGVILAISTAVSEFNL